jgi:pyruvate-formate lyase-activating enzyme
VKSWKEIEIVYMYAVFLQSCCFRCRGVLGFETKFVHNLTVRSSLSREENLSETL